MTDVCLPPITIRPEVAKITVAPVESPKIIISNTGMQGPPGPQGPPGASGTDAFEHVQSTPSASWVIAIPLSFGRRPNVDVYVGDVQVEADVTATSLNVNIQFPSPTSGSAVLT